LLADKNATSIPEKRIENMSEPIIPPRCALSMLRFSSSQIKKKKENEGEHDCPVCITETNPHYLMNTHDHKRNGERKENDVHKLHRSQKYQ
ncbi:MAG TPA: hypothetical protein VFT90_11595, partial [Chryseosolibacter sp.]|nr:hypothetical protein [Chryseosolibacter sp.]